jgi:hypothetical protein
MKNEKKKDKSLVSTLGTVGVLVIIAIILLVMRYQGSIGGSGIIELTVPQTGSVIIFENRERATTQTENEVFTANKLNQKTYSILVAKDGFWPWVKDVEVKKQTTFPLISWSLMQIPDIEKIETGSAEYYKMWKKIEDFKLPSEVNKLIKGNISVWVNNNQIFAEWNGEESEIPYYFCTKICDSRIVVLAATSNIESLAFFKERNDVLLFANADGVFVIEVNKLGTQNFQPIMRVNSPKFLTEDGYIVYIIENQEISRVTL